ncbi:MAG: two-component sensor histidine kinase [Proteobacteria bacterium]|nr:two-component sensor histidine kinase [Pseudomonadota bacterium]
MSAGLPPTDAATVTGLPLFLRRLWPRRLQGQLLLAIALALLLAQTISGILLYTAQNDRREAGIVHTAALRLFAADREDGQFGGDDPPPHMGFGGDRQLRVERTNISPVLPGERRQVRAERELRRVMADQDISLGDVVVVRRALKGDPRMVHRYVLRAQLRGNPHPDRPTQMMVAGVELSQGRGWLVVRVPIPPVERALSLSLIGQTLLLYALLVGVIALILGRLTRPLQALTDRVEQFAATRDAGGQLEPQGPEDVRRLIVAHNAMEARIASLLDEKDVMLGAIGHDLKTPLAALRVRIESVENESERSRMAATIEDIVRSLDDILSLARVGRPSDPLEPTELSALVSQVAEEYEDLGEPVSFEPTERLAMPLRPTWLRRALRNLVSNALRYGKVARITMARDGGNVLIRVDDDGPGIPAADIARMQEPFTRGDPSRNTATGGAGLGLALARAIAEQHGGQLELVNRHDTSGATTGLAATIRLPLR